MLVGVKRFLLSLFTTLIDAHPNIPDLDYSKDKTHAFDHIPVHTFSGMFPPPSPEAPRRTQQT